MSKKLTFGLILTPSLTAVHWLPDMRNMLRLSQERHQRFMYEEKGEFWLTWEGEEK